MPQVRDNTTKRNIEFDRYIWLGKSGPSQQATQLYGNAMRQNTYRTLSPALIKTLQFMYVLSQTVQAFDTCCILATCSGRWIESPRLIIYHWWSSSPVSSLYLRWLGLTFQLRYIVIRIEIRITTYYVCIQTGTVTHVHLRTVSLSRKTCLWTVWLYGRRVLGSTYM